MKKIIKNIVLLCVAALAITMVSCEKDEETTSDKKSVATVGDASAIAGNYVGLLTMYLQEMPAFELPQMPNSHFEIVAEEGGTVAVTFPAIEYDLNGRIMVLPSASQGGIAVTKNGERYTLEETTINQVVNEKSYAGSIRGSVEEGILTLEFSLKYGNMPMTLIFHFQSGIESELPPAQEVANNYTGSIKMAVEGSDMEFDDVDSAVVSIVANGDSVVSITIPDIKYLMGDTERTMAGFTVADVKVEGSKTEGYAFVQTEINQVVGSSEYVGNISGTLIDGKLHLDFVVRPGRMPMNIIFEFDNYEN